MITLNLNAACESGVEIADAQGELHDYALELAKPGLELAKPGLALEAYQLTRLDTLQSYRVTRETPHYWSCYSIERNDLCPAFKYRKDRSSVCKHIAACQMLTAKQKNVLKTLAEEEALS